MNILKVSLCLLVSVLLTAGATISGKWGGNADVKLPSGESRSYPLELQVTQKGAEVSGTIEVYGRSRISLTELRCEFIVLR